MYKNTIIKYIYEDTDSESDFEYIIYFPNATTASEQLDIDIRILNYRLNYKKGSMTDYNYDRIYRISEIDPYINFCQIYKRIKLNTKFSKYFDS